VGVGAEIIAIRGAIDPNLQDWEQRYLVLVLTLGTAGLAFWIAAPLLTNESGNDLVPHGRAWLAVLLTVTGVVGQFAITDSLYNSSARARYDEVAKQRVQIERQLHIAEGDDADARAHLIVLARSMDSPDLTVRIIIARLGRLDDRVLSAARDESIDAENVNRKMAGASRVLNDVDESLTRSFKDRVRGLDGGERELLILAARRVISAVSSEMTSEVNETLAAQRFESACEAAGFQHCGPQVVRLKSIVTRAHAKDAHNRR